MNDSTFDSLASRRHALRRMIGLGVCGLGLTSLPQAAYALPADKVRLDRRGELWHNFARKTENLIVRYASIRKSSMLYEPLRQNGTMAFVGSKMIFSDHDGRGSTTIIDGKTIRLIPNNRSLPPGPLPNPDLSPALTWLSQRMLAVFTNRPFAEMIEQTRAKAPKGRTPRIELAPPAGSIVRKSIRQLNLTLDPVGGAIAKLGVHEAQGDTIEFEFSDHRQNVDEKVIEQVFRNAKKSP